jgi:hypothetical protein
MTSFAKHIAVLGVAFIATTALADKSGDNKGATPDPKASGEKKSKKGSKGSAETSGKKKGLDIPVEKGHDSIGLSIPYFDSSGKRQMNFKIGVASRIDDNHINMKDLAVETFNEAGEHEMQIDLPTATLDTDTSVLTSKTHVTIRRSDFELTGDSVVFYTRTKQGGLGGNVHMVIFNLQDETPDTPQPGESKDAARNSSPSKETTNTPESKAK